MSTVRLFQDFQKIYGFCPCCDQPFRLSDATLFHRAPPPRTAWDDLADEWERLGRAEDRLAADAGRLRDAARELGRRARDRRLRRLISFFRQRRIVLADLRLIFHPVDYVAFRGLSAQRCTAVELIDRKPSSRAHERLQRSIERSISTGDVDWVTLRIHDDGCVSCR